MLICLNKAEDLTRTKGFLFGPLVLNITVVRLNHQRGGGRSPIVDDVGDFGGSSQAIMSRRGRATANNR